MNVHRFQIAVNCEPIFSGCSEELRDSEKLYDDYGFLALPDTYTEDGKATRLVISCHGAGGTVETDDSQVERQTFTKYLLANGYAVMDVNGLPKEYSEKEGIDIRNNIGSYIAVQSYVKAYHYCVENFNLKREVFLHGGSMGGISSTNVVLSGAIPVIAQSGFCPVLDTYSQIFLRPWSGGLPRTALGKLYQLEKDAEGKYIYDESRVAGYNPMSRCFSSDGKEYAFYPVPLKFWQCENDDTVSIEDTKRFVSAIRNGGGMACLRTFPEGGHEPQDYGDVVEKPAGTAVFEGETLEIRPAVEEAFLWIKRFD